MYDIFSVTQENGHCIVVIMLQRQNTGRKRAVQSNVNVWIYNVREMSREEAPLRHTNLY